MAELRARNRAEATVADMGRYFWRLALPGLATAAVLVMLATRTDVGTAASQQLTLATWYPISTDPTVTQ